MLAFPERLNLSTTLGSYPSASDIPSHIGWIVFDTGEFDRSPTLSALFDSVRRSSDRRLAAAEAGSPTALNTDGRPTGFVFERTEARGHGRACTPRGARISRRWSEPTACASQALRVWFPMDHQRSSPRAITSVSCV